MKSSRTKISGGKGGGRKGVGPAIGRRANKESINIKNESKEELFSEMLTPLHNQSRGRTKRGDRKLREG